MLQTMAGIGLLLIILSFVVELSGKKGKAKNIQYIKKLKKLQKKPKEAWGEDQDMANMKRKIIKNRKHDFTQNGLEKRQKKVSSGSTAENKSNVETMIEKGMKVYQGKRHFMSPTEKIYYELLLERFGESHYIFAQVRVLDIIEPHNESIRSQTPEWYSAFRQISQWHVDFVIVGKDMEIKAAIEIDDKTHSLPDRERRDRILNTAFENAGVKILRYSLEELNEKRQSQRQTQ